MRKIVLGFLIVLAFGLALQFSAKPLFAFAKPTTSKSKKIAEGYCVVERTTGRVLSGENTEKRLSMASTTKIITCILVIENCQNLDKIVEIMPEACGIEGSRLNLKKGEHLSVRELLIGLMVKSGNDAAIALAIDTFGSIENYQKAANEFVEKLGCKNTHIVTPNGLDDKEHYTCALDMAKIACYALSNDTFRQFCCLKEVEISNEFGKEKRKLVNKNKMLKNYEGATGVKTGFTKKSGRCLVSSAKRNGMELVCVVLHCDNWFDESAALLDTAFEKFGMVEIVPEHFHFGTVPCLFGDKKQVNVFCNKGFWYPLKTDEYGKIRKEISLPQVVKVPTYLGMVLGKICVYFENELIFCENIYTMEEVKSMRLGDIFARLWSDIVLT